jgi:hypothetical protein
MNVVYPAGPGPKREQQNEKDYEHQSEDHQGPEGHPDHAEGGGRDYQRRARDCGDRSRERGNSPAGTDETDLTKLKAGDKKRKASVKAAKAPKAAPEKAAKVAQPAKAKACQGPQTGQGAKEPKAAGTSKKDQVLALISRKNGASLDEIMTATGWQKHTVRGFIAILGKKGTKIESFKSEAGARTYKAA